VSQAAQQAALISLSLEDQSFSESSAHFSLSAAILIEQASEILVNKFCGISCLENFCWFAFEQFINKKINIKVDFIANSMIAFDRNYFDTILMLKLN
jgi:hypothetical protein